MAHGLRIYDGGVSCWVVSSQSVWLRVLPGGVCITQPRWNQQEGFWEVDRSYGLASPLSFRTFRNSSGCSSLLVLLSFPVPSVVKVTHASGFYLAWPGQVVSIKVSPNTPGDCKVGLEELAVPSFPFGGKFGEFTEISRSTWWQEVILSVPVCAKKKILHFWVLSDPDGKDCQRNCLAESSPNCWLTEQVTY